MTLARWDRHELIAQYEALRHEATDTASGGVRRGQGLALFVVRGMHAWLEALTALAPPVRTAPTSRLATPPDTCGGLRPAQRAELTVVLAGMVLACAEKEEVGGELRRQDHG